MTLPPLESGFPWERTPLAGISSTKILAELQRRRERSAQLVVERERIIELMDAIEERLRMIGHDRAASAAPDHPRKAPRARLKRHEKPRTGKALSLREAIARAVEPRALVTPAEAAELLKRNGYKSTAANFATLVGNALARDERFRRVGRGSYERIG